MLAVRRENLTRGHALRRASRRPWRAHRSSPGRNDSDLRQGADQGTPGPGGRGEGCARAGGDRSGATGEWLPADVIAPVIGLVAVGVLLYVLFAALFGTTAGVIAVAVLMLVGFLGFVGSLIVAAR